MRASEFFKACQSLDWFFGYSDDASVYRRGADETARLEKIANRVGGVFARIWADWNTHIGSLADCQYKIRRPELTDYNLGSDPDVVVDGPAVVPGLSLETQELLEVVQKWQRGIAAFTKEEDVRSKLFSHPDGVVGAILAADKETLRRMCDLRHADVKTIIGRLTPKHGDPAVMTIYGAEFVGKKDTIVHVQPDGKEVVFRNMRQMVLYIAARWH